MFFVHVISSLKLTFFLRSSSIVLRFRATETTLTKTRTQDTFRVLTFLKSTDFRAHAYQVLVELVYPLSSFKRTHTISLKIMSLRMMKKLQDIIKQVLFM